MMNSTRSNEIDEDRSKRSTSRSRDRSMERGRARGRGIDHLFEIAEEGRGDVAEIEHEAEERHCSPLRPSRSPPPRFSRGSGTAEVEADAPNPSEHGGSDICRRRSGLQRTTRILAGALCQFKYPFPKKIILSLLFNLLKF